MNKDVTKILEQLKELTKTVDNGLSKDEMVMLVCTAAIVNAVDKLEHRIYMTQTSGND